MGIIVREIQNKRDTAANFAINNPTLLLAQMAFELEDVSGVLKPTKFKVGDGQTPYTSLEYFSTGAAAEVSTKGVQTGTTIDYIINSNAAQVQTRDINGESGDITITSIVNLPLNNSIVFKVDGSSVAHSVLFSLAGGQTAAVQGAYQPNAVNYIVIYCLDDTSSAEEYLISYTRQGSQTFGTDPGDWPEIGSALGNSQIVETNASGQLITVAKQGAYNLGVASQAQAQDPTNSTTLVTPERVFDTLKTKLGFTTLTDGATITWNFGPESANDGKKVQFTLGGNRTLAIANMVDGDIGIMRVVQDGTGSRTLALPANSFAANGATSLSLSTGANTIDIVVVLRVGSNYYFFVRNNIVAAT